MQKARRRIGGSFLASAILALAAGISCPSCKEGPTRQVNGDVELGRKAIQKYGCGTCHIIPGVEGAVGRTSHPLVGFGNKSDIIRAVANTPENLIHWIQRPQDISPNTRMPNLGVTEADARNIAAYLYSNPSN